MEYGRKKTSWPSSHDAESEGSEPVFGEESGFMMITGGAASSGSPVLGSIAAERRAGLGIPSSDLEMRSGSKARAEVGVANPWKIKSPRIPAT